MMSKVRDSTDTLDAKEQDGGWQQETDGARSINHGSHKGIQQNEMIRAGKKPSPKSHRDLDSSNSCNNRTNHGGATYVKRSPLDRLTPPPFNNRYTSALNTAKARYSLSRYDVVMPSVSPSSPCLPAKHQGGGPHPRPKLPPDTQFNDILVAAIVSSHFDESK